ncbi:MAG: acyl-CoA dehydrogenase family protein, partial [Salinisphaera sp.]|nr:acyl-CoA dehydrogenase family protein [Salinisphaera sp.]
MSGCLSDERLLIQQSAREFTDREVVPLANELDSAGQPFPRSLIDAMGELGFFGILIPQELGGLGLGCIEYCL